MLERLELLLQRSAHGFGAVAGCFGQLRQLDLEAGLLGVDLGDRALGAAAQFLGGIGKTVGKRADLVGDLPGRSGELGPEVGQRPLGVGRAMALQPLELRRCEPGALLGRARQLLADGTGARLGRQERAFETGGITAHGPVDLVGLARQLLEGLGQFRLARLQRLVDAVVRRLQRGGRAHNGLALLIEPAGDAGDLADQVFRDVAQEVGLASEPLDRLE